ncbi:unnamed protein product [Heterobilharzia americana]|nr:unnamed protein product [Heterobilharzia americana]
MGRKVEDLVRVMRTLLSPAMFNLDSYVIPMSFDEEMYSGTCKHNLVIGYYTSLTDPNIIPVLKVNQMAVKKAVTALKKIGHRVVEFTVPHPYQAYILGLRALFADGGETIRKQLYGEPVGPHLYFLNLLLRFPNFLRPLADIVSRLAYGKPSAIAHATQKLKTGREAIDLITEINTYRYGFFKAWSDAGPLDALICPATPYPAPPKDVSSVYVTPSIAYTILYNLLDCPAGTVPVGSVTKIDIQESLKMAQSFSFEGNKYASKVFSLLEGAEGLPLAVQVVGKPYHEEIVLRVMRELEEHVDKVVL